VQTHQDIANRTRSTQRAPQCAGRAPHEIGFVERHTRGVAFDGKRAGPRNAVDRVVQGERLKDRAEFVEPVGAHAEHAQIEIDLRVSADRDRSAEGGGWRRRAAHRCTRIS
jgi:hypothetical protein